MKLTNKLVSVGCIALGVGMSGCVLSRKTVRVEAPPEKTAEAPKPPEVSARDELTKAVNQFGGKLNFDVGRTELRPDVKEKLIPIADLLAKHPEEKIRVDGFTDNSGSEDFNLKLSEERARSVSDFLVEHGARVSQLETFNHGESSPVASNTTNEGRAENRRVELKPVFAPIG